MLATMSHEIRSPLSGVVSVAEVLATTHLDAEQRQLVDVMLSSGDLVLQLINDILDLSKVESGTLNPLHLSLCFSLPVLSYCRPIGPLVHNSCSFLLIL
jgi:signal transduction histidine kinase